MSKLAAEKVAPGVFAGRGGISLAELNLTRIFRPTTVRNDSKNRYWAAQRSWENMNMSATRRPVSHEQKKIEKLLLKLAKIKPISAKPAPIADAHVIRRTA